MSAELRVVRWGSPAIHDYRELSRGPIKCRIAISPYKEIRGSGRGLYGFISFGSQPKPGDILQCDTPEHGHVELIALRTATDAKRWGEGNSYGVAKLSKWQALFKFHGQLRTTYPYEAVSRLEKIVWGLCDQLGGEVKLRWFYMKSGKAPGYLDFEAEDDAMVIKAVRT